MNGHFEVTRPFLRGMNANDKPDRGLLGDLLRHVLLLVHPRGRRGRFAFSHLRAEGAIQEYLRGRHLHHDLLPRRVDRGADHSSLCGRSPFTFRLYGNIFGGEYLLDSIYKMAPNFAFIALVPFYFYELLVAVVQAFVFFVLTAAFTGLITNTSNHPEEGH